MNPRLLKVNSPESNASFFHIFSRLFMETCGDGLSGATANMKKRRIGPSLFQLEMGVL